MYLTPQRMTGLLGYRTCYPSLAVHSTQLVKCDSVYAITEMVYTLKNLNKCIFH